MDSCAPCCFSPSKRSNNTGTYTTLPNPDKKYFVYTDASDDACRAQLSQEYNGMEFPTAFLSHMFTETQRKWSTTEQEAHGVYYAVTKWNYYLQGADITVKNDHKPLAWFLNAQKCK